MLKAELNGTWKTVSSTERNPDSRGVAGEASDGNNISNRPLLLDILAKILAVFCLCHKNLPEAILKNNGLISVVQEISNSVRSNLWHGYYW